MTVGARSRDARGDRPPGRPSSSPASLMSLSIALHPPSQLPPPPATIPANFRPAFLGFGRSRTGSRSVSSPAVDRGVARPARPLAHVRAAEPSFFPPSLRLPARQGSEHLVPAGLSSSQDGPVLPSPPPRSLGGLGSRGPVRVPSTAAPAPPPSSLSRSKPASSPSPPASPPPRSPPACSGDVRGTLPLGGQAPTSPARRSTSSPASSLRGRPPLRSIVVVPPSRLDAEGWLTVPPRRRPACRPDGGGDRPRPCDSLVSAAALRFRRRTEGLCAHWLDPTDHDHHHRSSTCCKPIRCLSCKLSGHKERDCPLRRASKSARPTSHPPRPRQPASSPLAPGALSWADVIAAPRAILGPAPSRSAAPPPPPPLEHAATTLPPQLAVYPCACLHADEMRAILSDMAASLRAELKVLVADAIAPFLAASSAACDRIERARGITSRAEVPSDVLLPILGASSPAPSPSLCDDEAVRVDDAARLLPEMKLNGDEVVPFDDAARRLVEMKLNDEIDPCQDFVPPCASPSCGSVPVGLVATPSPFGELQQHITFGVAPAMPSSSDDIVPVEPAIVKEGLVTSRDANSEEEDEAATGASTDGDAVTPLLSSVQDLFTRPVVPLLPCPAPRTPVLARVEMSTPEIRHSARLGDKPKMHTMDKVTHVLNKKMGIQVADDVPFVGARKLFEGSFKTQMTASSMQALNVFFKLKIPSLAAVDDALIGLAGPGGVEFTPAAE